MDASPRTTRTPGPARRAAFAVGVLLLAAGAGHAADPAADDPSHRRWAFDALDITLKDFTLDVPAVSVPRNGTKAFHFEALFDVSRIRHSTTYHLAIHLVPAGSDVVRPMDAASLIGLHWMNVDGRRGLAGKANPFRDDCLVTWTGARRREVACTAPPSPLRVEPGAYDVVALVCDDQTNEATCAPPRRVGGLVLY